MSAVILLELARSVMVLLSRSRLKCCEMFQKISVNRKKNLPQPWPAYVPRRHEGQPSNNKTHLLGRPFFGTWKAFFWPFSLQYNSCAFVFCGPVGVSIGIGRLSGVGALWDCVSRVCGGGGGCAGGGVPLGAGPCCPDLGRCLSGVNIIIITSQLAKGCCPRPSGQWRACCIKTQIGPKFSQMAPKTINQHLLFSPNRACSA